MAGGGIGASAIASAAIAADSEGLHDSGTAQLILTTTAPAVSQGLVLVPATANLTLSGTAPTIQSANHSRIPATAQLVLRQAGQPYVDTVVVASGKLTKSKYKKQKVKPLLRNRFNYGGVIEQPTPTPPANLFDPPPTKGFVTRPDDFTNLVPFSVEGISDQITSAHEEQDRQDALAILSSGVLDQRDPTPYQPTPEPAPRPIATKDLEFIRDRDTGRITSTGLPGSTRVQAPSNVKFVFGDDGQIIGATVSGQEIGPIPLP